MNIAKIIQLDLAQKGAQVQIGIAAVAGDRDSRSLTFRLTQNGVPWEVPSGTRAAVAFRSGDRYSGEYDRMPDGSDAFSIAGDTVTVRLIDQIMAEPGFANLMLVLRGPKLEQISSFPIIMEVDGGIGDSQQLPQQYYNVRDLGQINAELARIAAIAEAVDTAANVKASQEARLAAQEAREAALSVDADEIARSIAAKGDDLYVEDGRMYLLSNGEKIGEGTDFPEASAGMSFDSGFVDGENRLHLTKEGADIEGFTPFLLPVASGTGVATVMRLSTSLEHLSFSILDREEACIIPFEWTSVIDGIQTGSGFAEWTVNGSRVALTAVEQGENSFDVRKYLTDGSENTVRLKVTDVYSVSRVLTFTITVRSYSLSWNLGETGVYTDEELVVRLTPVGSGEKVVKVSVDGEVVSETTVTTTGRTTSVTVPGQGHGAHTIKAWMEVPTAGEPMSTESLVHVGAWLRSGVNTPVVGILTPEVTVGQYGTAAIRYFAADPAGETTTVTLKAGDAAATVLTDVDRSVRTWYYKAMAVGEISMVISCGTASKTAKLTVTSLGYDIGPVTAGLQLDLDPAGRSNDQTDRTSFGYTDADGVNHPLTFSENFDWVNGGFKQDDQGVTAFVVRRGCRVELDRGLFDTDCRSTGRNIKLIFKSENVRNYDAQLMTCKSGNVGLVVNAQQATVTSQLETMSVPYYEGRKIEMDICIEAENEHSLAWIDMKAIPSCPPVRYGSTDTWGQSSPAKLVIGSDDADVWIYRLKLYGNSLNRYEVLDNFIADCGDPGEMVDRFERNDVFNDDGTLSRSKLAAKNGKLRVIHLRAGRMTTGKEDEVTADLEMVFTDGGERHHLTAEGITFKAQGTSSLEYILAALNLDIDFSTAVSFTNGLGEAVTAYAMTDDSIPVSYFNLKANVASSESANNVCLADDYNTFDPFVCAGKTADSRVRDTVEGHPCAVFFTNTSDAPIEVGSRTVQPAETILYFAGDMNNSKKNFAVFGQDNSKWPKQCCVEVMNNTEKPCRFLEDIAEDEKWKDGNFEFRFPKSPTDEMKTAFLAMHHWVVSCDPGQATDVALAEPVTCNGVTYYGDSAEYRRAKFVSEFENWFVKDQMLFHYLFTERHCMTDNRAKNLFFCYEFIDELKDYRWSVRCDYDNDTAEGCDNSGGATFRYGIEDTDIVGSSYAFNAHDSVLWCSIRDLMADDLKRQYISMRGSGVWNAQRVIDKFNAYQDATPEAVRIEDMWNKYFLPAIEKDANAYMLKCHGDKESWREQFEQYQQVYMDSKYCDVTDRSNALSMRATIESAEAGNVTLTGYSDMYFVVMYGNGGTVRVRANRNVPTLIECPTDSLGDTETYIFSASHLTAISSLAALKPKFVLATTAARLQELIVGSGEIGYQNLNMNQIGVGSNTMLRLLDLRSTPNLVTALDLTALMSLEEFYANGSGLTGVTFARNAPLKIARVPAVSSFVGLDLKQLETFVMDGKNLKSLRVENCPMIDTLALCKAAKGLERGRLTDVDWNDEEPSSIARLASLTGFDAQGKLTDKFVLTGKAHVSAATQTEIDAINAAFPELELTVDAILPSYIVTFCSYDGTVVNIQQIREGGYAKDPVTAGYCGELNKPSDVEHHYTRTGWDKALGPITQDTVITAVYTATDRYYRVSFWSDEAESSQMQEESVIAHGSSEYKGEDPAGDGIWIGWDAEAADVVSDMDIHPVFVVPEMPEHMPEKFDYLYSDDPEDDSALTMAQFMGIVANGASREWFQLGDRIKICCSTENFMDSEIVLELRSFKHFLSAERSGEWAGPYFGMVGLMNATRVMNTPVTNVGGFPATTMLPFLNEVVYTGLPQFFRNVIEKIKVLSSAGNTSAEIVSAETYLTLESSAEVNDSTTAVPYVDEIAEGADEVAFACYTDITARIKKTYNGAGTAGNYWLRSPAADSSTFWRYGHAQGLVTSYDAGRLLGVSFGFCLRPCLPGGEG